MSVLQFTTGARLRPLFVLVIIFSLSGTLAARDSSSSDKKSTAKTTPASQGEPPGAGLVWLDALLPGYGAFYFENYITGGLIATGRVGTLILAARYWRQKVEYRSAERAARTAEFVYGLGFRYKDPYGGGYYTSEEFRRLADRRGLGQNLALSLHAVITLYSFFSTRSLVQERRQANEPIFQIQSRDAGLPTRFFGASGDGSAGVSRELPTGHSDTRLTFGLTRRF